MDRSSRSNSQEYVDFEVEVRASGRGEYSVRVLRSPAGEPQQEMSHPFPDGTSESKLKELEEALHSGTDTRSGKARHLASPQQEEIVKDFGQSLFRALLGGEVFASYRMSLAEANQRRKGLRLKLRVEPPELARLPWEFLYDPGRQEYVFLSRNRALVRYLDLNLPVGELHVEPPLRILGVVASPLDMELLDVEREKRRVEEAVEELQKSNLVELKWLEGETYDDLEQAMSESSWHVLHFIGHGLFDPESEGGVIALVDEAGRTDPLRAEDLASLLMDHYDLKLVFLNSCEGARSSEGDVFSSYAATLVRRGVPAVVAMQYEITDEAAISFSRAFYRAVAGGLPVDAAVARARMSVKKSIPNSPEWGTPVLYTHSSDGRLFDVSTEAANEDDPTGSETDPVPSPPKPWWRRGRGRTGKLAAVVSVLTIVASILGLIAYSVLGAGEEQAIKGMLTKHYENEGNGEYKQAFADFAAGEQGSRGGLGGYTEEIAGWCPPLDANPQEPVVEVNGTTATATVRVHYWYRCDETTTRYEALHEHSWTLAKAHGEWKLHSDKSQPVYDERPSKSENDGDTFANLEGEEKGNLESITVSNARASDENTCGDTVKYKLANLVDGRGDTAWQVAGTGVNEWVELRYAMPIEVSRVGIIPGYVKTDPCDDALDRFYQMYVVREARIAFSDGRYVPADFKREPVMQYFNAPPDTKTSSIRITILDTYPPGEKPGAPPYPYTLGKASISEIEVEGS